MKNKFFNTGKLVRFILRRERVSSTIWILAMALFSIGLAPMLANIFDDASRNALIETINNPAMIGMLGPIYGIDNYTAGAMYFNMMIQWIMITAVVMNIVLVVRHTRTDEENGRIDIFCALPTGKLSNLTAVMITTLIVNVVMAIITAIGIAATKVESMDFEGALLYSLCICMVGLVFAALTAVFAELCHTSRGAVGLSMIALGFLYLLRGAGDIKNETLSLISPLGLAQRTEAFVENNWTPIFILGIECVVITLIAFALHTHRDIRQGYLPERKGRATAPFYLHSPFGLAFRLVRMPFFAWLAGLFTIGAAYGSILGTIDKFVQSNEFYAMMIGANPDYSTAQMFVSMVNAIMSLFAVAPVLMMILKLRSEEKERYFENVLSRSVSRYSYMTSFIRMAILTSILAPCVTALGIYSSALAVLPDPDTLPLDYLLKANLVYVPALLFMLGVAVLLIGFIPRMTAAVWAYYAFAFFVTFLGRLPDTIPEWVSKLSPFGYIPNLPIDEINLSTLMILSGISFAMITIGLIGYRRRDILV